MLTHGLIKTFIAFQKNEEQNINLLLTRFLSYKKYSMSTKFKNVFNCLLDLEDELSNFSFEKLTAEQAKDLKDTFKTFKDDLEHKFFGGETSSINDTILFKEEVKDKNSVNEKMLIANVSHELRTPLNGIIGFADLLRESTLTNEQVEHVNAIQSASSNLMQIISELLEYSKLSASLHSFESVDFNFKKLINDITYLCKALIANKEIELTVRLDSSIPRILKGDPSKLSQVLLNLIGNAIKFVEKGKIQLQITQVGLNNEEVLLEFDVVDTGIGMSQNNLKHIFEPFKQAESSIHSKYGGTGLGLNIVKQIIESLNGKINVSSSLGKGSTFRFLLPYKKGDENHVATEEVVAVSKNDESLVKNMQILVFEDDILNQRLIEQRLNKWKCNVFVTDKAIYGLNILKNNKIDMVLMDLKMPEMDGYQITEKIRTHVNVDIKNIPIVAITADLSINDKEKCNKYGINDFILKPYSSDELLGKLIKNKNNTTAKNNNDSNEVKPSYGKEYNKHFKVNLDNVYHECMEEMEMLEQLVSLFKLNTLEFIGKVKLGIKGKDYKAIKFSSHKIKAGLKMMETFSLSQIVEQIHNNCEDKDILEIEKLYNDFLEEYPVVEIALDKEIERLKQ